MRNQIPNIEYLPQVTKSPISPPIHIDHIISVIATNAKSRRRVWNTRSSKSINRIGYATITKKAIHSRTGKGSPGCTPARCGCPGLSPSWEINSIPEPADNHPMNPVWTVGGIGTSTNDSPVFNFMGIGIGNLKVIHGSIGVETWIQIQEHLIVSSMRRRILASKR